MANKTKNSTRSYVDFDPYFDLVKEEALDTLIIKLPDFKKDQLRVQVNKQGDLKISGERPINPDGTKRSRFLMQQKLPEGCDVNGIRAKFIDGHLHVIMPKKTPAASQVAEKQPALTTTGPQSEVDDKKSKAEGPVSNDRKTKGTSSYKQPKGDRVFEHRSSTQRLLGRKVVLGLGIAAVTMIAIGAFVAYKYGTNTTSSPSYYEELGLI